MGKIRIKAFDETSPEEEAKLKAKKEAKRAEKAAKKAAATPVVEVPQNGSRIVSPSFVEANTILSRSQSGF